MIRIVKNFSYSCSCHKFSYSVKGRGLMLILLLSGDVSLNPGPLTLGVVNTRSVRNKGSLLDDIVASNDLDILCLTETHVCPYDLDSFLRSITPAEYIFPQRYRWWCWLFHLFHPTAYIKWNLLSISHLKTWWFLWYFKVIHCFLLVSIALQDHVPAYFRKNLLVSCHPSTLVISTFMLMFLVVTVINL